VQQCVPAGKPREIYLQVDFGLRFVSGVAGNAYR